MMAILKFRSIAAMAILATLAISDSCRADLVLTGDWLGLEAVTMTNFAFPFSQTTETFIGEFSFTYDTTTQLLSFQFDGDSSGLTDPISSPDFQYGPQSFNGLILGDFDYYGIDNLNFFISYASVPPDGILDSSNSVAGYNATTYSNVDLDDGTYTMTTYYFNSAAIPEPSTFVLEAGGLAVLGAAGLFHRLRRPGAKV